MCFTSENEKITFSKSFMEITNAKTIVFRYEIKGFAATLKLPGEFFMKTAAGLDFLQAKPSQPRSQATKIKCGQKV